MYVYNFIYLDSYRMRGKKKYNLVRNVFFLVKSLIACTVFKNQSQPTVCLITSPSYSFDKSIPKCHCLGRCETFSKYKK